MGPLDEVPTPALVVDLAVLDANLASMAAEARRRGVDLRPHAKTHKSVAVGRRQLAAGAVGLSVATVGEAEVFARHGFDDLFIAYPLWADRHRGARLGALAERTRLAVGVDSVEGAQAMGRAGGRGEIGALVEVDSGHHRSGCRPEGVAAVARAAERAGLTVRGVFTFPGHGYAPGGAARAAADEGRALATAGAAMAAAGLDAPVRSGGSTPTARWTSPEVTELRPGVYAFNDAQQVALGSCAPTEVALVALATIVSAPAADRVVLDAGSKILGADRPHWLTGHGIVVGLDGAVVTGLSEHHAVVQLGAGCHGPVEVGRRVAVVPNHVCTAVNLVDELVVVRDGTVVATWPVDARGALS